MDLRKPSSSVRVLVRPPSAPRNVTTSSPASASHAGTPPAELTSAKSTSGSPLVSRPFNNGVAVVGFVGPEDEVCHLINRVIDASVFGAGGGKDLQSDCPESADGRKEWFRQRRIRYHHESERGTVFLQFSSTPPAQSWRGGDDRPDLYLEQRDSDDLRGLLLMFSVCHVIIFLHDGARFDTHLLKKFRMLQSAKHALTPFLRAQVISPSNTRPPVQTNSSASPGRSGSRRGSAVSPGRTGSSRHSSAISLLRGSSSLPSMLPGQCIPVILFVFLDDSYNFMTGKEDSSTTSVPTPGLSSKVSSSILMLSRPINKQEGSLKKKLQSSLEGQIRFLIKKCRILSSVESTSRSAYSVPLFCLDSSRVAVLLDRSTTRRGESLDYVTNMIELISSSKATADILESSDLDSTNDDFQSIKDFISRQMDALRGRGSIPSSGGSGSVGGVGMVAAAAAAAAASTSSGKPVNAPDLPSLEKWLSSSRSILEGLLSTKNTRSISAMDSSIARLDGNKGLNMRFSTGWCQRALPAAKEIYLKDLPSCYPTIVHRAQLEKALEAFHRMVKGPAVKVFSKKLEDECQSIWESGRQLCDAISLTRQPCMHQMHHLTSGDFDERERKHCSGFVFLHACACGRSRSLRDDPFDFDSANVDFSFFPKCESQLPRLHLPEGNQVGSLPSSSWIIVRLGGASYYNSSKGLLQSGFCRNENFLLKWTISCKKHGELNIENEETLESEHAKSISAGSAISFGKGLPSLLMKKPFSEVVAGSSASKDALEKDGKRTPSNDQVHIRLSENVSSRQNPQKTPGADTEHFLQIGSNAAPVIVDGAKNTKDKNSLKRISVYVGFEHECPSGHRFILSMEHLKVQGSDLHLSERSNQLDEYVETVGDSAVSLLNKNLPVYMNCPHCTDLVDKERQNYKFSSRISQLQRIFLVTPPLPFVLSTCPIIQFEDSCLPASVSDREKQSQFSPGCPIILPPNSFISLRLPFIYGVRSSDGTMEPLHPSESQPELTASLVNGTALQFISKGVGFVDQAG